jgi:rare lipoprotein A
MLDFLFHYFFDPCQIKPITEHGIASWYGKEFHGLKTASGEKFDMYKLTAASNSLPMQTKVRVTNKKNGKYTIVRINDRGGFTKLGRIIDLSYAAAKELKFLDDGLTEVKIEVIK